jgi:hypothetical protein
MPTGLRYILACYFDASDTSLALLSLDSNNVEFFNFPYKYSQAAFSNQISEAGFNKDIIETFLKNKKIKTSDVEVITSGFIEVPLVDIETKLSLTLVSIIKEIEGFYPFVVNEFSVLTKDAILSYEMCSEKSQDADGGGSNELANLSIYPQIIPVDLLTSTELDRSISEKVGSLELGYKPHDTLSFSGSRFSRTVIYEYLDWILAFDMVRKTGIYEISLDRKNVIPLFNLIKKYKPEIVLDPKPYIEAIGTLINSPGDTECLLTSDVETNQFFDVKKDGFYAVPMLPDATSSLSIKSHTLGNLKMVISGGRVGLIINTGSDSLFSNVKVFNDCVKQLSLCTPRY